MTIEEILELELNRLAYDLVQAYDRKGMRASGQFEESLEITTTPFSAKLTGINYSEQLEFGRRGGTMPPVSAIKDWIEVKGIKPLNDLMTTTSLAWAIAKKIEREGWNRQGFGGVDLISEVVTPERIQSIINKVGEELVVNFTSEIVEQINELVI